MKQQVVVKLTQHHALRCEKLGECLWPGEKLTVEEISRRLLLEHLLWAESKRNLLESVRALRHVRHVGSPQPRSG